MTVPDRYRSAITAPAPPPYSTSARISPGTRRENPGQICQTSPHPAGTQDEGSSLFCRRQAHRALPLDAHRCREPICNLGQVHGSGISLGFSPPVIAISGPRQEQRCQPAKVRHQNRRYAQVVPPRQQQRPSTRSGQQDQYLNTRTAGTTYRGLLRATRSFPPAHDLRLPQLSCKGPGTVDGMPCRREMETPVRLSAARPERPRRPVIAEVRRSVTRMPHGVRRTAYGVGVSTVQDHSGGSKAGTSAAVRRTGTGWVMPGRTRTKHTQPGAAVPTASNPTRKLRISFGGSSPDAWQAIRWRGSRGR